MITKKYSVQGMSCAACQAAVEQAVSRLPGIESVSVSLLTNSMSVSFDETLIDDDKIMDSVNNAGYRAGIWVKSSSRGENEIKVYKDMKKRLLASAVFALLMMYVTMGHMVGLPLFSFMSPSGSGISPVIYAAVQLVLSIPVIIINKSYFIDGFKAIRNKSANMNTLIAVGSSASLVYGIYVMCRMIIGYVGGNDVHEMSHELYFESVTMILTLISLGKTLEFRARRHTSDAVRKLMELTPKTAEVRRGDVIETIPSEEIKMGDIVIVRAGSLIPCDGIIVSGGGAATESVITGESIPVPKEIGSNLICGTILSSGYAEIEAVHVGEDTTVAKIAQLVEDASSSKAPIQKLADKISRIFVPVVCSISLVTFIAWLFISNSLHTAIGFGISVLVISCPCALGLATPTAIMSGVGRGATLGILIKSADAIDTLSRTSVVVLDKTGTITNGQMKVEDIYTFGDYTVEDAIKYAASIEQMSEHPIGVTIVEHGKEMNIPTYDAEDFTQTFGGGVRARINGHIIAGGNPEFISQYITLPESIWEKLTEYSKKGKTPVIFAIDDSVLCIIAIADTIKSTSREAVSQFAEIGFDTIMLTGDCEETARAIAEEAGINHVISGVKPDEKASSIESIMTGEFFGDTKRRYAVMVGDGVNDAPALAMSDCGMAVARGTDIAIESASVVLVRSDLTDAVKAVRLSKAVLRNIAQNLIWAFGYNVLCIPIAAGVLSSFGIVLTPMIAAAAMSLSSICVVSNALRLKIIKI